MRPVCSTTYSFPGSPGAAATKVGWAKPLATLRSRNARARRADGRRDAEQVEMLLVARVVHARDHLLGPGLLACDLADHHVVLVVARDRCDEVRRPLDARALEHVELGPVAELDGVLELRLQ